MNYRHSYHAGNFADVLKHIVLARVITYMKNKPQPFRIIDTHAGAGCYDLAGVEAGKTGEWQDGIGRLMAALDGDDRAEGEAAVAELIAPYVDAVKASNDGEALRFYPGSPMIARHLKRREDTLVANELHPEDQAYLKDALHGSPHCKVMGLDGWVAIRSLLPPPERRGVVLIDPPFESRDEFRNLGAAIEQGLKRFAQGVFIAWYPIKDRAAGDGFLAGVQKLGCKSVLDVRLSVGQSFAGLGLMETGVTLFNPPFSLEDELRLILPWLCLHLGEDDAAQYQIKAYS